MPSIRAAHTIKQAVPSDMRRRFDNNYYGGDRVRIIASRLRQVAHQMTDTSTIATAIAFDSLVPTRDETLGTNGRIRQELWGVLVSMDTEDIIEMLERVSHDQEADKRSLIVKYLEDKLIDSAID